MVISADICDRLFRYFGLSRMNLTISKNGNPSTTCICTLNITVRSIHLDDLDLEFGCVNRLKEQYHAFRGS